MSPTGSFAVRLFRGVTANLNSKHQVESGRLKISRRLPTSKFLRIPKRGRAGWAVATTPPLLKSKRADYRQAATSGAGHWNRGTK